MTNEMISKTKDFDYNDQQYRLFISYNKQHGDLFQPLYYLDGNTQSDVMLQNNNETDGASILYVGIGYQDGVDPLVARAKDYTIPAEGEKYAQGGGAENFYQFISQCVIPWVNSEFDIDTDKQTLSGHSYGGMFALYVALNHPQAFQNYVAASPSIWWGNGILIPQGQLQLDASINVLALMIGEYEEIVSPYSNEAEKERIEMINADAQLRCRNLAVRLISNEQRCDFIFCPGRRHGGVIKDYAKVASIIAGQKPASDGL